MVKAIVGANWGDEGKGKITDVLANDSDIVIRFQGGANAGHTIVNDYGKFALHQLPSGVFHQGRERSRALHAFISAALRRSKARITVLFPQRHMPDKKSWYT